MKYGEEHLFFSLPPGHPLSASKALYMKDLNGETMLLRTRLGFWRQVTDEKMPDTRFWNRMRLPMTNFEGLGASQFRQRCGAQAGGEYVEPDKRPHPGRGGQRYLLLPVQILRAKQLERFLQSNSKRLTGPSVATAAAEKSNATPCSKPHRPRPQQRRPCALQKRMVRACFHIRHDSHQPKPNPAMAENAPAAVHFCKGNRTKPNIKRMGGNADHHQPRPMRPGRWSGRMKTLSLPPFAR